MELCRPGNDWGDGRAGTSPQGGQAMTKRELVSSNSEKRFIRRDAQGRFTTTQADVGASLTADRRRRAETTVPKGQGDRGDQRRQ